ncbi:hypothetical protein ACFLUB_01110 [Chloroflexota bacterium]
MNEEIKNESIEQELPQAELSESTIAMKEVEEVKEAIDATVSETSLPDKVVDLRDMLEHLSDEVEGWKSWHKSDYLGALETLKTQVEEIQNEWDTVSSGVSLQQEKLESLLQSFPGVIETATLKALTLRVTHLEKLLAQLFTESQATSSAKGSRRQLIISYVALAVTIILWGLFIGLNLVNC